MSYRISFKDPLVDEVPPHPHSDWIKELRSYLPSTFNVVSNDVVANAWEQFSNDYYCAGWLIPSQENVDHFVGITDITNEDTDKTNE